MTAVVTSDWLVDDSLAPEVAGDRLAPLYAGARTGILVLPFCGRCATPLDLEQIVCDACASRAVQWRPTRAEGIVHSATLVHRVERGLVHVDGPYPVIDVETVSGHRIIMTTAEPSATAPAIGSPVTIAFRTIADVSLPAASLSSSSTTMEAKP